LLEANTCNGAESIQKDGIFVEPKEKKWGGKNKHCKKMAMQEEHIIDIALNGENYCASIHKQQHYFVAGASIRMCGLECSHHRW
jgi:hypothetical protein